MLEAREKRINKKDQAFNKTKYIIGSKKSSKNSFNHNEKYIN